MTEKDEKEMLAARRIRMLRLGAGWSAEKLSQEYRTGGGGDLARGTIAKIESDKRPIKAGEVDGVARVFGLTSNDLLDVDGPKVFLSYAEHDGDTAQQVADWLGERGFQLLSASPTAADLGSGLADARAIDASQAFVVLLSPSFLSSPRCQQQLGLAERREMRLLAANPDVRFIYVLQVTPEVDVGDSGLSAHPLIDLPTGGDRSADVALSKLGGRILAGAHAMDARAESPFPVTAAEEIPAGQEILARGEERGEVLNALTNSSGVSLWLVIGPPGFGKSWLLAQLETEAAKPESGGWDTKMIDLRGAGAGGPGQAAGNGRLDAMTVISSLFGMDAPKQGEAEDAFVRRAALNVMDGARSRLFLLDSAELLSADTVRQLRDYAGQIYRRVQDSGREDARLAFVAAGRRDDGWRGVMPSPGPSLLQLGGFGPSVIQDALEWLARDVSVVRSPAELRRDAELVHRVTEGVPELILQSLKWIREEHWLDIERLEDDPEVFEDKVAQFAERRLLAKDSVLPAADGQPAKLAEQVAALREGIRVLVPYRLITQSHVSYHAGGEVDDDRRLRDALKEAGWQAPALWQAITKTALLLPLQDTWREIHPAVRRLLFRHLYRPEERTAAHAGAAAFAKRLASQLRDRDQISGLVEAIWHEVVTLRPADEEMGDELVASTRKLSANVHGSEVGFSEAELRNYAVQRMSNDAELQHEAAKVKGLFDRLIEAVAEPGTHHV